MHTIRDICRLLEDLAPLRLAEEWDNVGLLVGDHDRQVSRLMTCLTLTPASVAEAIQEGAELVVAHHPLPFRPVSRITRENTVGQMLLDLIAGRVAVYSPHTAFDSARSGINEQLVACLQLREIVPLVPESAGLAGEQLGGGRCGNLDHPQSVAELASRLKPFLGVGQLRIAGNSNQVVRRVAVACGSGGSFLDAARQEGCDCLITGETTFHTCLEAAAAGVSILLCGHYASERFAVEWLADFLAEQIVGVHCWASRRETDPLQAV